MNCPKCGENSAVQSMRTIVSGGISNTSGSAISYPILGEGALTATYFGSTTSSVLADRLMPPGMPTARVWPWIVSFTTLFVLIVPKAAYDAVFPSQGYFSDPVSSIFSSIFLIFGILIGAILGILFAIIMRTIGNATWMKPIQEDWYPRSARVWNTYYCGRDDTMFDEGYAATPEDFISHVWFSSLEDVEESSQLEMDSTLVESLQHNAMRFRNNNQARGINATQFEPLSITLGQISFAEAREILKERFEFPSVARSIQISRKTHEAAKISSKGALTMLGDLSTAGMAFYGAAYPVGQGGFTEQRAIAASVALSQRLWEILDDSLANNVKSRTLETGPEVLLSFEVTAMGYFSFLSRVVEVLPDIQASADQSQKSFADVWAKETGITVEAMSSILHCHRDTLLCTDFYREQRRANDGPSELWGLLSIILKKLEDTTRSNN